MSLLRRWFASRETALTAEDIAHESGDLEAMPRLTWHRDDPINICSNIVKDSSHVLRRNGRISVKLTYRFVDPLGEEETYECPDAFFVFKLAATHIWQRHDGITHIASFPNARHTNTHLLDIIVHKNQSSSMVWRGVI